MKVYFDVCCLNRQFDDQTQSRIRLEAEAIVAILARCAALEEWSFITSEVVEDEILQTPDIDRQERLLALMDAASENVIVEETHRRRASDLTQLGLKPMDALHVACAEASRVDVLLTTDDRLIRAATRNVGLLLVGLRNPLAWIQEIMESERNNSNTE